MSNIENRYQRRRQETRNRIVEAGGGLFVERGVQATKVAEICEAADVAQQTFFNHFPSKRDLVREIALQGHAAFLASVEAAHRAGADTRERLALLLESFHARIDEARPVHHELISESIHIAQGDHDPERARQIQSALGGLLRAGIEAGDVTRRHDLEDLVDLVFGALTLLALEWASREDFPIAARAARMARLLADALAPHSND